MTVTQMREQLRAIARELDERSTTQAAKRATFHARDAVRMAQTMLSYVADADLDPAKPLADVDGHPTLGEAARAELQAVEDARAWRAEADKAGYTGICEVVNPSPTDGGAP